MSDILITYVKLDWHVHVHLITGALKIFLVSSHGTNPDCDCFGK